MASFYDLLAEALRDLGGVLTDPLQFADFANSCGVTIPSDALSADNMASVFPVGHLLESLGRAIELQDTESIIESAANIATAIGQASSMHSRGQPFPFDQNWFWAEIGSSIFFDVSARVIVGEIPAVLDWMRLLNIAELVDSFERGSTGTSTDVWKCLRLRVYPDRIPLLFRPLEWFRTTYGWGGSFNNTLFLQRASFALQSLGLTVTDFSALIPSDRALQLGRSIEGESPRLLLGFGPSFSQIDPIREDAPPDAGLPGDVGVILSGLPSAVGINDGGLAVRLYVGSGGSLPESAVQVRAEGTGVVGVLARPSGAQFDLSIGGDVNVNVNLVKLLGFDADASWTFGSSTRLEIGEVSLGILGSLRGGVRSGTSAGVVGEFGASLVARRGRFVISPQDGDGFLRQILPSNGLSVDFDLGIGWTNRRGVYISGGAGLEVTLPVRLSILGIIAVDVICLVLCANASGVRASVSGDFTICIGPVTGTVQKVGLEAGLAFPRAGESLGIGDLHLSFKPPSGVGLSIDAGPVSGGGFISYDEARGRYAGVLQLTICEIGLTAAGVLDTQLPGGASGYSFFILIAADFMPIQLGFGFTLNGVGGMAGVNRSISQPALQRTVLAGTLDHILFPHDPIAHATEIISDIEAIFPPVAGQYVFGPIAKLGWGSPSLVTIELGLVIELPDPVRIVLLGKIGCVIPSEAAVVELHLDLAGAIDFGVPLVWFLTSLHDSRVAAFTISGDTAFRMTFGDDPTFLFSCGGFHPSFHAPAEFPHLRRLSLSLDGGDYIRLTCETYFAVTSNTIQLGADAHVVAAAGGFSLEGRLGFDALVQFKPFHMQFDFVTELAVKRGTTQLIGISVHGRIEGPSPWHITGSATISILFFDISVDFDATIGSAGDAHPLPRRDPLDDLLPELANAGNWSAPSPTGVLTAVALAPPAGEAPCLVLDPVGGLAVRQKKVPLHHPITTYAEAPVVGDREQYDIVHARICGRDVGDLSQVARPLSEPFAAGHYAAMNDHDLLSQPSFDAMQAGLVLNPEGVALGQTLADVVTYEEIRTWDDGHSSAPYVLPLMQQRAYVDHSRAALVRRSSPGLHRYAPPRSVQPLVTFAPATYVLVSTADLTPQTHLFAPGTQTAATQALASLLASHPELRGQLAVIPAHQARAAGVSCVA